MKNRRLLPSSLVFAAVVSVIAAGALWAAPPDKKASPERPESVTGKSGDTRTDKVQKWVADVFPYGEGPITVDEMTAYKTPGYRMFRASKKYNADARMADRCDVIVDDEGKIALLGDIFVDEERAKADSARPVKTEADLGGATELLRHYLRGGFKIVFDPTLDRKGWRGVKVLNDTGYGKYSMAGFVREADGVVVFLGNAWDFKTSLVEQRKAFLKTADTPLQGSPDARVTIVEFSDMQCGFCKKRTLDFEALTAKLAKELTIKRYIKFFPLTNEHPWAFRAASAGRCFFLKDPSLFFRWKSNVYAKQDEMTVSALDAFAMDFAVANDISDKKFMDCYLQPPTSEKILSDLTEGFAARVRSTPTYFIDGVNVSWFSDNVMEEFVRKKYLEGRGLPLPTPVPPPVAKGPVVNPAPPATH